MKFGKKALTFCLTSLLLCSCGIGEGQENSEGASQNASGDVSGDFPEESSADFGYDRWDEGLRDLMKEYCGGVLPYPDGLIGETIHYEEFVDEDGENKILKIYDESKKFTLGKYYETLEQCGWVGMVGYNEEIKRTVDNYTYYELNKTAGEGGYNLSYTFQPSDDDVSAGNVIFCRNGFTTKLTSKTEWTTREKENIELGLNISLPFMAFGNGYKVEHPSEDVVIISDCSVKDLSEEYGKILEGNGFFISPILSQLYDRYVYMNYMDERIISVGLDYKNGNRFKFEFSAIPEKTEDWPSHVLQDIESECDVTIPQFEAPTDLHFYYNYKKNDKIYVYTETSVDIEHETDYYSELKKAGFKEDIYGNFENKEKGVKIDIKVLTNKSLGQMEQYGFQIIVYRA